MSGFDRAMRQVDWAEVYRRQELRSAEAEAWLDALELRPDSVVADVGAGPGFVTLRAAARLGPGGRVYAVDRRPEALAFLRARLAELRTAGEAPEATVQTVVADAESFHLPRPADAALLTHVLHHADRPRRVLEAVFRALIPGGRLLVAEYDPAGAGEVGPPLNVRIGRSQLQSWLRAVGFQLVRSVEGGQEQYALLVARPRP